MGISYERIYNPIQIRFTYLDCYELMKPIIREALESITKFKIPYIRYINNKSKIEEIWGRRN